MHGVCPRLPQTLDGIEDARVAYPPSTFGAALDLSESSEISALYNQAERLPSTLAQRAWMVPARYISWPNGQLSALTRNGSYADNLTRWFKSFDPSQFTYVELSEYGPTDGVASVLRKVYGRLPAEYTARVPLAAVVAHGTHRHANASGGRGGVAPRPTGTELARARALYAERNERLFELIGRRFPHWADAR